MKKILACVLAAATVLSLSATAFAARTATFNVTDSDGDQIKYGNGMTNKGGEATFDLVNGGDFDTVSPDQDIYVYLGQAKVVSDSKETFTYTGKLGIPSSFLGDKDYFTMSTKDKSGDASKLIKITQEESKSIDGFGRSSWLKIAIANTMTSDELKGTMTLEFKPRKDLYEAIYKFYKDGKDSGYTQADMLTAIGSSSTDKDDIIDDIEEYIDGEKYTIDMTFWVNNRIVDGTDADEDTGEAFVFNPDSNETNTIIWGDDRAALKFDADDDASKFYAKLSTKSNSAIWSEYADPVGADLWFYDFVGATNIPATSRATLTLGIPWDEDDDYSPASPEDCFIYRLVDGELQDVTKNFSYNEDGDIDGWSTRTRELGTFIVSDMELDIEVAGAVEEPVVSTPATTDKVIPNTGSSDMVNVAVVAAVVSLAAAGAVAFRKVK